MLKIILGPRPNTNTRLRGPLPLALPTRSTEVRSWEVGDLQTRRARPERFTALLCAVVTFLPPVGTKMFHLCRRGRDRLSDMSTRL